MPLCPFPPPHRLLLKAGICDRCGNALPLVAEWRAWPVRFFNRARRLWDTPDWHLGQAWLKAALQLRPDLGEAYWLLAAIELRHGRTDAASHYLTVARSLQAPVSLEWLAGAPAQQTLEGAPPELTGMTATAGTAEAHSDAPDIAAASGPSGDRQE